MYRVEISYDDVDFKWPFGVGCLADEVVEHGRSRYRAVRRPIDACYHIAHTAVVIHQNGETFRFRGTGVPHFG